MCGIAGCVAPPGARPDREALHRMAAALAHRGPDGSGVEVVGSVGLAHTRLAIVDPRHAADQPMNDPRTGWWISYNGELFNHLSLRERLGDGFATGSDTETALRSLATDGLEALTAWNGFFAFAALDVRGERLLLARDRFGVKPLYVAEHAGRFWFASEIRALLAAGIPAEADVPALEYSLVNSWMPGPATILRGIEELEAGCWLEIDLATGERRGGRWFSSAELADREREAELARLDRTGAADELERLLRAAVERRMMADVPIGVMCSGGLDSSLVAAYAHDYAPGTPLYNAAIPDQPEVDEARFAEAVASDIGAELRSVPITASRWREELVAAVDHLGGPRGNSSAVAVAAISRRAHADGVKAIVTGEAADELFGGYAGMLPGGGRGLPGRFLSVTLGYRALLRVRRRRKLDYTRLVHSEPRASEAMRRIRTGAASAYAHHPFLRGSYEAGLLRLLDVHSLPALLDRLDANGMQHSIEMREPFLDPELMRFAANLRLEHRVAPGTKGVLRDVVRRRLGSAIADRGKQPFVVQTEKFFADAARPGFLSDGALRETLEIERAGWRERIETATGQRLLRLWTGEIWARLVLEAQSRERIERELWLEPAAAPTR